MVHVEDIDVPILVFLVQMHRELVRCGEVVVCGNDLSCGWIRVSIHQTRSLYLQHVVLVLVVELDEYA